MAVAEADDGVRDRHVGVERTETRQSGSIYHVTVTGIHDGVEGNTAVI